MKMSNETYNKLKSLILEVAVKHPINAHKEFLVKEGKAKDIEKRLRWDYFNAATVHCLSEFVCGKMYKEENLNDDHIDSALKKIFAALNNT